MVLGEPLIHMRKISYWTSIMYVSQKSVQERLRINGKSKTIQLLQGISMDLGWKWPLSHCQFAFRFFRYLKKTHTNEQRQQAKQTKNPGTSSRIWVTIYKILQLPHTQILQLPKSSPQSVNQIFHCCFEQEKSSEGRDILYDACKSCSQVKSDTEKNPKSCRILRGTTTA